MNVTISKATLLPLLARCQNIADKKYAMPVLANILLEATDSGLRVWVTDLALGFEGTRAATVKRPGAIAVPARETFERVKAMPDGDVVLVADPDAGAAEGTMSSLTIKAASGNRRFKLPACSANSMPARPTPPPSARELSFPVSTLLDLIGATHYAISTDETRLHLNSALLEANASKIRAVATDGHRLALKELEYDGPCFEPMLLPLKGVLELKRLLEQTEAEAITLRQHGHQVFAGIGGDVFTLRLTDASPVPWEQVVPKSHEARFTVGADEIANAVRAVKLAASDRTGIIKLTLTAGKLRIETESPESGEGFDEVAVEYDGANKTIGFNANYLIDAIGSVSSETVVIEMSDELDPIAVKSPTDGVSMAIVMPARV